MLKNIQMKIEIPIPFARSRLIMAESIAKEVKITESKIPIIRSENPVSIDEYSRIGMPHPSRNARTKAVESPKKNIKPNLYPRHRLAQEQFDKLAAVVNINGRKYNAD